jgi:hypothetical protein
MDEMFRMLGREHEADLEREALRWQRAANAGRRPRRAARAPREVRLALARLATLMGRTARAEA